MNDGFFAKFFSSRYFVQYFAPSGLETLKKHITFVMDTSSSVGSTKLRQVKEAMETILGDLQPQDYFSFINYSDTVKVSNEGNLLTWKAEVIGLNKCNNSQYLGNDVEI